MEDFLKSLVGTVGRVIVVWALAALLLLGGLVAFIIRVSSG